jgi:hypothetical protein
MNGYYTVELTSANVSVTERIVLETLYAEVLEARLGGHEQATAFLLGAGTQHGVRDDLKNALQAAETEVRARGFPDATFAVRAWAAFDL